MGSAAAAGQEEVEVKVQNIRTLRPMTSSDYIDDTDYINSFV